MWEQWQFAVKIGQIWLGKYMKNIPNLSTTNGQNKG